MNIFIVISFLGVIFLTTFYAYKRSRTVDTTGSEGLFLGGRSLNGITVAAMILMTNLSTEQVVGLNAQAYIAGMEVMAWEVTAAIAIVALALIFLPKYFKYGITTIPEFLEMRFDSVTKKIVSLLFIITYIVSFLPVVLYSGALVFNRMFRIDEMLGVDSLIAITIVAALIGILGILFLLMGGLKFNSRSDVIWGLGLLLFGLLIPFLGLRYLGSGSFVGGVEHIVYNTPWLLNSVGAIDSDFIPWPTLFTGMLFNNLYFWCTNQMIIQKSFGAKNLAEAQKGVLIVGVFKIVGALFLVFPGIVARNIFGDALLRNPDVVYPYLVAEVLPYAIYGIFAAIIFGTVLSSFSNCLNATSTLFSVDFYKPRMEKKYGAADDKKLARYGKITIIIVGIIVISASPMIAFAPAGLFQFIQEFNGFFNVPLLVMILFAFYSKRATALSAKVTLGVHVSLYSFSLMFLDIHFLYVLSALFFLNVLIMFLFSKFNSSDDFEITNYTTKVDMTPWKNAKVVAAVIILIVLATYVFFSPLGIAS